MKRRQFLRDIAATTAALSLGSALPRAGVADDAPPALLKGFIVSDAHFGWEHQQQPPPDEQREMMARILRAFPDLDLFIDTGDAHHGGATDAARGLWTEIIPGGCGPLPFYYVPGNHEIIPPTGVDQEWRCNVLGSLECRPYYSFDCKGIHFVSVPQMSNAVFVNRETLEWLSLDLRVHKDQTILLLTHNNLPGTTSPFGEIGYRGIVNSDAIRELLAAHPNVIAWLHGHNHTYGIVAEPDRLFVSNGRIGGFVPPEAWGRVGQGHLGGVHFEVGPGHFRVRCYSATAEAFLDELDHPHLSAQLHLRTSFDAKAPPRYCFGYGGARDGHRIPVYHHHASSGTDREVFLAGAEEPDFNDDPEFACYVDRYHPDLGHHHQLMGASVQLHPQWAEMWVENSAYEFLDPGIRLLPHGEAGGVSRLSIPFIHQAPGVYYRVPPGESYRAVFDLDSASGGERVRAIFKVHDRSRTERVVIPAEDFTLEKGRGTYTVTIAIPESCGMESIYSDPSSDNTIHLSLLMEMTHLTEPVIVRRIGLSLDGAEGPTRDVSLTMDGVVVRHSGELPPGATIQLAMTSSGSPRSVVEARAGGNRRVSWLIRSRPDWQVRNAPVQDFGDHLRVGPLRNAFPQSPEIVIVPLTPTTDPYVHRIQGVRIADIYPRNRGNRTVRVAFPADAAAGALTFVCRSRPRDVLGAMDWSYERGLVVARTDGKAEVELILAS